MPESPFTLAALDPTLIKGIYDTCDQWCMYCPATSRCLALRCDPELLDGIKKPHGSETEAEAEAEAEAAFDNIMFQKEIAQAEGRTTPEIDFLLADNPFLHPNFIHIRDPLEKMGRRYDELSHAYLISRPDYPFEMRPRPSGPTPLEVFAWFHTLIGAKIFRALMSVAYAARGDESRRADVLISAKVALIGMDRSLEALQALAAEQDDPRLELLQAHLRRLRRDMEGRFPGARSVIRPGLDDL